MIRKKTIALVMTLTLGVSILPITPSIKAQALENKVNYAYAAVYSPYAYATGSRRVDSTSFNMQINDGGNLDMVRIYPGNANFWIYPGHASIEHTRYLQVALRGLGYKNIVVDGSYGPATQAVIKDFQVHAGISADGTVGPGTWNAINDHLPVY